MKDWVKRRPPAGVLLLKVWVRNTMEKQKDTIIMLGGQGSRQV